MASARGTNYFPFRPDVWSSNVNRFFYKKLACAPFFWDLTDEVTTGGKTIVIPSLTEAFVATAVTTTTGAITDNVISDSVLRLDIDKWYVVSRLISDYMKAQIDSQYGTLNFYQQDQGYSLANQLDTDLVTLADGVQLHVGSSTTTLAATNIEDGIRIMQSYSIPRDELMMFLHPNSYWGGPMRRQKYYDASQFGRATLPYGVHDVLYGVPVVLTTQILRDKASNQHTTALGGRASGFNNFLAYRRSFAYALGNLSGPKTAGIRIQTKPCEDLAMRVVADIMYGVKRMSTERAVCLKCSTGS